MPRHWRSRRRRLLASIGLGLVALLTIGSVGAGSALAPGAMLGIRLVAGAADPAATESQGQRPSTVPGRSSAPIAEIPDARDAIPGGAPPLSGLTGYRWPLPNGRLTQPFGPTASTASRVLDGQPFHDGIDLATFCGDRIVAAHDGVVLAASRHFDDHIGWLGDLTAYYRRLDTKKMWTTLPIVVVVEDGNGYRSMYAHFEKVVVAPGQRIRAGDLLGYEGATGRASGCHLHYGLFSLFEPGEIRIDPGVARRMKLPRAEIARVDPLLVLPPRAQSTTRPQPAAVPGTIPPAGR